MKGVVLAGGKGSRLRPFTYSGAKQLVPIANVPVLHFPVNQLVACGITDIALVVGETEPQIRAAMGDGSRFGARFSYIRQEAPLGIAHGLGICRQHASGEPVVLYLGDNVLLGGISDFVRDFAASRSAASVILKEVHDPRAFGVGALEDGRLTRIVEKPAEPETNLAVIGVYAFRADIFDIIDGLTPSARGELEIADAINGLIGAGLAVDAAVTADYWIDTGKMEDMLEANGAVLGTFATQLSPGSTIRDCTMSGIVTVADGAVIDGCEILGPVAIGPGARLTGSRIGPNVAIGEGCTVSNSSISNAIIMESTSVRDCPGIVDSMIGRFASVNCAPSNSRLVLGDHSRFEVGA
ncbi:MAG: glucose-1-phosphate thymidylyltransferase [bacterium]